MRIVIRAHNLPGRRCDGRTNVHVALQEGTEPVHAVPGDAREATWETEVRLVYGDPRGPAVHGKRGERFLYLTWGDPHPAIGDWRMFRRTKLMLAPALEGAGDDTVVTATVDLTDERGLPRSARLSPPAISWDRSPGPSRAAR